MSYQLGSLDPEERIPLHGKGEPPPARRPLLTWTLVILVMAVFAGGLWLAYRAGVGRGGGPVPLIRAERGPAKVRPSSPGGLQVPDQNMLIYNEGHPRIERLLPGPEEPLPRPAPKPAAATPPAATAPPPEAAGSPAAPAAEVGAPRAASSGAAPAPAAAPARPPASAPALPAAAEAPLPRLQTGTRIQLGALRSAAAARAEWERLKRANPEILGPLSAATVRADLGERGIYYRIEAGPFANPSEALRVCGELRRRDIGCLLVR